ncbi:MAG: inverse autotransporter beta domain-containing protein [Gemmataceae bacterium]
MNGKAGYLAALGLILASASALFAQIQYISPSTGRRMQIDPVPPMPGRPTTTEPVPLQERAEPVESREQPVAAVEVNPVTLGPVEAEEPAARASAQQPRPADPGLAAVNFDRGGVPYYFVPDYWVDPRFSVRRSFGDGIGYDNGYTYLEAFVPFLQEAGSSLLFANSRVVNYDHADFWEFQFGGGARRVIGDCVVAGLNGFYDGRNTNFNYFHQLGLGWEALGPVWEWRGNVYIPIGQQRAGAGSTGFFNPQFVATNISLDRFAFFETAMNGVDTEIGRSLLVRDRLNLRGYVGFYHYSNDNVPTANGIRGRLEAWVSENLSFNFAVQNDAVFDTTVTGGLAMHLGGLPRGLRRTAPLQAKLGERVVRDPNIVVQRSEEFRRELAIDPATGAPIEVRHVSSSAAPGGDGSIEHPFQNLTQLQNGSGPNMILFAHSGSVFNGEGIALQNSQRFLGEGIPYFFTATQGTFLLPTATGGTVQPRILNAPGNAVMLASNTEVANFGISNAALNGVRGIGVNNFNLHDLNIQGAGDNGIYLTGVTGTGLIVNNTIANNGRGADVTGTSSALGGDGYGNGILIESSNFSGSIASNTITGNGSGGTGTANAVGVFSDAVAVGGEGLGNGLVFTDGSTFNGSIANNTITGNGAGGSAVAQANGLFGADASAAGNGNGYGILIEFGSVINGPITGNTISGNGVGGNSTATVDAFALGASAAVGGTGGGNGMFIVDPGSAVNGPISGNTFAGNGVGGNAFASGNAAINANAALGGAGFGSGICTGETINGSITGNTFSGNGVGGSASAVSTAGLIAADAALGGDGLGSGIDTAGATINGSITGNTFTGNGNGGAANAASPGGLTAAAARGGNAFGFGMSIIGTTFNGGITNNTLTNNGRGGNATAGAGAPFAVGGMGTGDPTGIDLTGTTPTGGVSGNTASGNGVDGTP